MKTRIAICLALSACSYYQATMAAEPLTSEAMETIQITPPTPPCKPSTDNDKKEACNNTSQLQEQVDERIRETQETTPLQSLQAPVPQPAREPDVTPQQLQIIDNFKSQPWGR